MQSPGRRQARLAVVPVQEKQRERAHDQEKQDPDPEASVVLDSLERQHPERRFNDEIRRHRQSLTAPEEVTGSSDPAFRERYLSDVLVSLFDVFRGAHDQLMNAVYLRFLFGRESETAHRAEHRQRAHSAALTRGGDSPGAGPSQQRSPGVERSPPPSPRFACREKKQTRENFSVQLNLRAFTLAREVLVPFSNEDYFF